MKIKSEREREVWAGHFSLRLEAGWPAKAAAKDADDALRAVRKRGMLVALKAADLRASAN